MKRLKKALLLPVRYMAYRWGRLRIYYRANEKLFELRAVNVMPDSYYRLLYHVCMKMIDSNILQHLANRVIHTIPYDIRFSVA